MDSIEHTEQLARINTQIVSAGEILPVVQLQDGSRVQTGTVATMLFNIARYNAGERGAVEQELALAIPTLNKVGLFELFPPTQWIQGENAGRRYVGELAQAYLQSRIETDHALSPTK